MGVARRGLNFCSLKLWAGCILTTSDLLCSAYILREQMEIFYICFKANKTWVEIHDPRLAGLRGGAPDRFVKVIDHDSFSAQRDQLNRLIQENNSLRIGIEDWKRRIKAESLWQFLKRWGRNENKLL